MMIHDKSAIQDETEQKLDKADQAAADQAAADQAAAADPSRYAETDVFFRMRECIQVYVEKG